jgi:hypothetical protein
LRSSAFGSSRCRRENESSWSVSLALGRRAHVAQALRQLAVDLRGGESLFQEADVAEHHGEQVVEVVCDAGGELAHRLQPLHLPQGGLDPLALLDLREQLAVRRGELGGALLHARFQLLVEAAAFVLAAPAT